MPLPTYPRDWSTAWTGLQRQVRTAYTAAQTRVRFAAIKAASILVGGGGSLEVEGRYEEQRMLHVGRDAGGATSRLWLGRPKDGSAVLDLRSSAGEAGQWALRDQQGNAVVAEGPQGIGLARPVMPVATQWIADFPGRWPSSTSTSWTRLMYAWAVFQHTAVTFYFKAAALSAAGEIRLRVDGTVIGSRSIPTGVPAPIHTERFVVDGTEFLNRGGPVRVDLEVRCTGENGGIYAIAFYNEGGGTAPAAPEAPEP